MKLKVLLYLFIITFMDSIIALLVDGLCNILSLLLSDCGVVTDVTNWSLEIGGYSAEMPL